MVNYKGKEYQLTPLVIRDEAKLAKHFQRMQSEDFEIKADAMIEIVRVQTGIDIGDLNGGTLDEVRAVFTAIMEERKALREAEPKIKDEAQGEGKA
jgi:hypothetical protein